MQWIKWVTCFCSLVVTDHCFSLKMLLLILVTTCVGTYGGQSSQRSWEERWWPTGLLTPLADTCPAAPQARTTWHALVFGVDEKCIWDKSCLRKKTWGSGHPLPPQSILCSLRNKLDYKKFYSWTTLVEVHGNPPHPALLATGVLFAF